LTEYLKRGILLVHRKEGYSMNKRQRNKYILVSTSDVLGYYECSSKKYKDIKYNLNVNLDGYLVLHKRFYLKEIINKGLSWLILQDSKIKHPRYMNYLKVNVKYDRLVNLGE
jgi:hypothetical protein